MLVAMQALYKETLAALQELLKSVLAKDLTPDGLQSVFKVKPQTPLCISVTNPTLPIFVLCAFSVSHFSPQLSNINRKYF